MTSTLQEDPTYTVLLFSTLENLPSVMIHMTTLGQEKKKIILVSVGVSVIFSYSRGFIFMMGCAIGVFGLQHQALNEPDFLQQISALCLLIENRLPSDVENEKIRNKWEEIIGEMPRIQHI